MATEIKLSLSEREGKYDVSVASVSNEIGWQTLERAWEKLDMLLQKVQADGRILYCGRQRLRNGFGPCRFFLTVQMKEDLGRRNLAGERRRIALERWLTRKINE